MTEQSDDLSTILDTSRALLGHNGGMPARRDAPQMPDRAAAAHQAIAGTTRMTTLRYLLDHPASTRPQIADATGMSTASARVALVDLEGLGYVTADVEGPRNGRTVRYSANRSALTDDLTSFVAWMLR